ncbi:hypothetical protein JCM8202v2_005616 [Rhodotorula sphaerocarpa]
MSFDFLSFRLAQEARNALLLTGLDAHVPPSPGKKQPKARPAAKRGSDAAVDRPSPTPASADAAAESADREQRGLRSSSRVKNQRMGVKAEPARPSRAVELDDGEDEIAYYENGKKVRTGIVPEGESSRDYSFSFLDPNKRTEDTKRYGPIPGVPCGSRFLTREGASNAAIHGPWVAGIATGKSTGGKPACASICVSGGYVGDIDLGERLTFSGAGGRELKGNSKNPKNLRTAPQSLDQSWENPLNAALKHSVECAKPIRLLRGYQNKGAYAPPMGYRYDGLYQAIRAWEDKGPNGLLICRVALVRLPGQPPLPVHPERQHLVDDALQTGKALEEAASTDLSRTAPAATSEESHETKATTPEAEAQDEALPTAKRRRTAET